MSVYCYFRIAISSGKDKAGDFLKYANDKKLKIYRIFTDKGTTIKKLGNVEELMNMIDISKSEDTILFDSIFNIVPDVFHSISYISKLLEKGVTEIYSIRDDCKITKDMLLEEIENYRLSMQNNEEKMKKTYGYSFRRSGVTEYEPEQETIREIFRLRDENESITYLEIARHLDKHGYPQKSGRKGKKTIGWTGNMVRKIIDQNRFRVGGFSEKIDKIEEKIKSLCTREIIFDD